MKRIHILLISTVLVAWLYICEGSAKIENQDIRISPASGYDDFVPEEAPALLDSLPYYGNRSKCRMTAAMAKVYYNTLTSLPEVSNIYDMDYKLHATLIDLADDGYPFLVTSYWHISGSDKTGVLHHFYGFYEHGAAPDTFTEDAHFGRAPVNFFLCDIEGKPGLMVIDIGAQNTGLTPEWDMFYLSEGGVLKKVHELGAYSANITNNGATGSGTHLPNIKNYSNKSKNEAPVSEFKRAGWLCPLDYTNAFTLWYFTFDGIKMDLTHIPYSTMPLNDVLKMTGIDIFNLEKCMSDKYGLSDWVPHQAAFEVANILLKYSGSEIS